MKTGCGNCDNCKLLNESSNKDFIIAFDRSNLNDTEIYVVTDTLVYGKELFEFLKKTYPNKKFIIVNYCVCKNDVINDDGAKGCCYPNIVKLSEKVSAKYKFIYKVKYNGNTSEFNYVNDLDDLKSKLDEIYNPVVNKTDYYCLSIDDKFYTDKYRLIDVQYNRDDDKVIYIFRDNDNNKIIYNYPSTRDNFYWYEKVSNGKIIENIDDLKLSVSSYKKRDIKKNNYYGCDVDICTRHCVEYYLKSKGECLIKKHNMMFFDIETYQYQNNEFPDPDEPTYPIVAFSFRTDDVNDHTHVYLLKIDGEIDKNVDNCVGNYKHVTVFNDEILMIKSFFNQLRAYDVDYLCAWNGSGFDIPYVVNRMRVLGIDKTFLTKYGECYAKAKNGSNQIPGYVALDQLKLFKEFTHGVLPSYSLNNVAIRVLGKEKVQHVNESIDQMYSKNIDKFLRYSTVDTDLIYEIEKALGHCALQNEIRRVASCSHRGATSTLGLADGIYQMQLKKKGLISRNYTHDVEKQVVPGAYVFNARPGLYNGLLCDFDFKSLYPTIICTWNIGPDTYIGKINPDIAFEYLFNKQSLKNRKFEILLDPLHTCKTLSIGLEQFEAFIQKYDAQITIIGTIFCGHSVKESINYDVLNMLMDSRSKYKTKMLEAKESGQTTLAAEYNDKQLAFKIIANALYGALGNEHFRYYNPILASSITSTGQEMLKYCAVHLDYYMQGRYKNDTVDGFVIDPKFKDKVEQTINVVYGDTDSVFVYLTDYLKRKKMPVEKCDIVLKEVSKIQDYVNNVILPTVLKRHNVNLSKSMMYLKNEFLMSRYYALNAKKKYASHVISQEGKSIDEIDVKGLEIKRSEIPMRSRELLKNMLDIIMDESNSKSQIKSKINKVVETSRKEISDMTLSGNVNIAKVVSFSKKIEEYKVTPQHLLGMFTWNSLMNQEVFKHGTKGRLFNVMGIDLSKAPKNVVDNYYNVYNKKFPNTPIEAIVIPEDMDKLPEYFIPDLKTTVKYCCDDRVELLMSGLYVESDSDLLF